MSYHYDQLEIADGELRSGYSRAYAERRRRTLELVRKYVPPKSKLIDIAAAQGNFALALAELGYEIIWNDLRGDLADYVEQKREHGTVHYLPGNAFELSASGTYDCVLITEVIEHVAHPDDFLAQAARLTRPGGHVIMTTPNGEYFRNRLPRFSDCADPSRYEARQFLPDSDGHIFLLHTDEVRALAKATNLDLVELALFNNPITAGALGTGRILPHLPDTPVRLLENMTARLPKHVQRRINLSMGAVFRVRAA